MEIFSKILNENVCYDPSYEPFWQDRSNEGSQNMFILKIWKTISKLSLLYLLM